MHLFCLISLLCAYLSLVRGAVIKGRLDVDTINITGVTRSKSLFKLYQVGNYSGLPFYSYAHLKNDEGDFEFTDVPVNPGMNATTHFVLYSSSIDFNLKPNRILVELVNKDDAGANVELNAYKNIFGREYLPSPDIIYPEKLEKIEMDQYIPITLIQMVPMRAYYEKRNIGMFQSGPLASLLDAKWKQAGLITAVTLMAFPYILEKLDPETAKAVREEKLKQKREKYQVKQE